MPPSPRACGAVEPKPRQDIQPLSRRSDFSGPSLGTVPPRPPHHPGSGTRALGKPTPLLAKFGGQRQAPGKRGLRGDRIRRPSRRDRLLGQEPRGAGIRRHRRYLRSGPLRVSVRAPPSQQNLPRHDLTEGSTSKTFSLL
ncbi:hypothetical protein FRUB_04907 [Fimbriiglobus ruber]|uniref:Uncharacterized protein n=1 Tax=Fimbriiglobus ruber TaxID=1908690 RepID=A0A225DXE6_9BACT|nr:hypothetical protein FRUB_04907 [Fimbriiglobus ruber]